jgi:hypothetical protein
MRPITFSCHRTLPLSAGDIAGRILDVSCWPGFQGYGPIPGIQSAQFEVRTPAIVGSRIRVCNRDGSSHIEEIVEWQPAQRLCLQLKEFSPPLSHLASRFEERWGFEPVVDGTVVVRSLTLYPRSYLSRIPLWFISLLLKRAIARHLQQLR